MLNKLIPYSEAKQKLTIRQKIGQLFMHAVFINDTEKNIAETEQLIAKLNIGALCFFHSRESAATNFEGKEDIVHNKNSYSRLKQLINRYQKAAHVPLLIAIDAEWGLAMRIEDTNQYPYALSLGALTDNEELITEVGKQIALDCARAGIHWNLAPVVDVNTNPKNPVIGYRAFGDNKHQVTKKADAFIKGMNSVGIINTLKHFPGHGDTDMDSHLGLPEITKSVQEIWDNELYPFQKLIDKGVDAVMAGHLSIPEFDDTGNPSTTSSKIITDLLRESMGFEGVIISDALNMHAVSKKYQKKGILESKAFHAGMDMLCFSEYIEQGIDEILSKEQSNRIERSFERVWSLKAKAQNIDLRDYVEVNDLNKLNSAIARRSITELSSNSEIFANFNTSEFMSVSLENDSKNYFSAKISSKYSGPHLILNNDTIEEVRSKSVNYENLLIALFPNSVKPKNKFGIDNVLLDTLNDLISVKNVMLYLFGNPYFLYELKLSSNCNIVVAYQDFKEFQEQAVHHFDGNLKAQGQLPFNFKYFVR